MRFGFGLGIGDGQQFVTRFGAGPWQQFEIVMFRRRIVGTVKPGNTLFQRGQIPGRSYEADEQRLVVCIKHEYTLYIALGKCVAVGYGHSAHRFAVASDGSPYRASKNCGTKTVAGQKEQHQPFFHSQGYFEVSEGRLLFEDSESFRLQKYLRFTPVRRCYRNVIFFSFYVNLLLLQKSLLKPKLGYGG